MYCIKCGKEIADNATYCRFCGAEIGHRVDNRKKEPVGSLVKIDAKGLSLSWIRVAMQLIILGFMMFAPIMTLVLKEDFTQIRIIQDLPEIIEGYGSESSSLGIFILFTLFLVSIIITVVSMVSAISKKNASIHIAAGVATLAWGLFGWFFCSGLKSLLASMLDDDAYFYGINATNCVTISATIPAVIILSMIAIGISYFENHLRVVDTSFSVKTPSKTSDSYVNPCDETFEEPFVEPHVEPVVKSKEDSIVKDKGADSYFRSAGDL